MALYFLIGKLISYVFLFICIFLLFLPKGRSFLGNKIFDDIIFGDMILGTDTDYTEMGFGELVGIGTLTMLSVVGYILLSILLSLLMIIVYPIPVLGLITGLVMFRKKKNN